MNNRKGGRIEDENQRVTQGAKAIPGGAGNGSRDYQTNHYLN